MRVMDGLMSFPTLLLALLVLFTLGPSRVNIAATPAGSRAMAAVSLELSNVKLPSR